MRTQDCLQWRNGPNITPSGYGTYMWYITVYRVYDRIYEIYDGIMVYMYIKRYRMSLLHNVYYPVGVLYEKKDDGTWHVL